MFPEDSSEGAWIPEALFADKFYADYEVVLGIAKDALSKCLNEHQLRCSLRHLDPGSFLPTRLIDLEILHRPRLIISAENEMLDRRYVPLSHQWGTPGDAERRAMTTVKATLAERLDGFDLRSLPMRYQAAVLICHSLGIRYVWIDSLCILQDWPGDLAVQLPAMGEIYENGIFTICLNFPATNAPLATPTRHEAEFEMAHLGKHEAALYRLITRAPLTQRAWCLQERHLSVRVLHVWLKGTWIWECNSRVRESSASGLLFHADVTPRISVWGTASKLDLDAISPRSRDEILSYWDHVLADYSRRHLTVSSDKLPALSGIASRFQKLLDVEYLAGIWEADVYGLLWHVDNFVNIETFLPKRTIAPSPTPLISHPVLCPCALWRAPSWAWPSLDKPIHSPVIKTGSEREAFNKIYQNDILMFHSRQHFIRLAEWKLRMWTLRGSASPTGNERGKMAIMLSGYICHYTILQNLFVPPLPTTIVSFDRDCLSPRESLFVPKLKFLITGYFKAFNESDAALPSLVGLVLAETGEVDEALTRVGLFKTYIPKAKDHPTLREERLEAKLKANMEWRAEIMII